MRDWDIVLRLFVCLFHKHTHSFWLDGFEMRVRLMHKMHVAACRSLWLVFISTSLSHTHSLFVEHTLCVLNTVNAFNMFLSFATFRFAIFFSFFDFLRFFSLVSSFPLPLLLLSILFSSTIYLSGVTLYTSIPNFITFSSIFHAFNMQRMSSLSLLVMLLT